MRRSDISKRDMYFCSSGDVIMTVFYEDLVEGVSLREPPLLVIAREPNVKFDEYIKTIKSHQPKAIVPPYSLTDQNFTSSAAERVRAQGGLDCLIGVMMCGKGEVEELDFLAWAHTQNYAPIVIPPDRRPRSWQLNQMFQHGALGSGWYHLAGGDRDFDVSKLPGTWTYGEAI
jgi:hypothetical protein